MPTRLVRNFIHGLLVLIPLYAGLGGLGQEAIAFQVPVEPLNLRADGLLRLYSYHLDEFLEIRYKDVSGTWDLEAYKKIQKICRSRAEGEKIRMDRRLIELADHLQDHFAADVVEIISCYRSPAFNQKLKTEGHNVANESLHTIGMAMDIHLDEIRETDLRDYLLKLKLGGVGYYGNRLMVHMDFGSVRTWTDGEFKNNTGIGIFNKESAYRLRTDRLFYGGGDDVQVLITGAGEGPFPRAAVEKFARGKWVKVGLLDLKRVHPAKPYPLKFVADESILQQNRILPDKSGISLYGKYRLKFERDGDWQNSNEFYIKR